jgi:hypothetical protein
VALVLLAIFPTSMGPLPAGMKTPIVAFELARTSQEVELMFGPASSPERATWSAAMTRGNQADFLFMALYGLYFVLFSQALAAGYARSTRWSLLAALPALMDALENLQLFAIASRLGGSFEDVLPVLHWCTWGKWLSIALLLTLWIRPLSELGAFARTAALTAALTAVMSALAIFVRGMAAELMGLGVTMTLILTLIVSVRRARTPTLPAAPLMK